MSHMVNGESKVFPAVVSASKMISWSFCCHGVTTVGEAEKGIIRESTRLVPSSQEKLSRIRTPSRRRSLTVRP